MYLLPIHTYSDYWRAGRVWSVYAGGLAVFLVGSHYSAWSASEMNRGVQPVFSQTVLNLPLRSFDGVGGTGGPGETGGTGEQKRGSVGQGAVLEEEGVREGVPVPEAVSVGDEMSLGGSGEEEVDSGANRRDGEVTAEKVAEKLQVEAKVAATGAVQKEAGAEFPPEEKEKAAAQNTATVVGKDFDLSAADVQRSFQVESTAYTYTGNKTATGLEPREGLIAVDPKVIALGSKVYVEGYGYAVAADTGGAIRGNKIDVFFPTRSQCRDWGRRNVKIYVLE